MAMRDCPGGCGTRITEAIPMCAQCAEAVKAVKHFVASAGEWGEVGEVRRRRFREARDAGLTAVEARLFAESDIDVGLLRKLVASGCPSRQIARVLL